MNTLQLAADVTYSALPNLDSVKSTIVSLAGTVVIIILVVRVVNAYAKKQWGELISEVVGILVVGWFVWDTDGAVETLKGLVTSIFG